MAHNFTAIWLGHCSMVRRMIADGRYTSAGYPVLKAAQRELLAIRRKRAAKAAASKAAITPNEASFLNSIAYSEYTTLNGARPGRPDETMTWLFLPDMAREAGITTQQGKGVLTSLKVKGWVWTNDEGTDEAGIGLTEEGFEVWQQVDRNPWGR